jgi:uncharacterized protein YcbK (DUF882 family)
MRKTKGHTGVGGGKSCAAAVTRRSLLRLGAIALIGGVLPRTALGELGQPQPQQRSLSFFNTHTGERLRAVYWEKGRYIGESLAGINQILRDHRANEVENIDIQLLDLLFSLQNKLETSGPLHVISGYRSANTNAALRAAGSGVAQNSLHCIGKAIDIRVPSRELRVLHQAAVALKGGGVGYYPRSDFVHVDVGRVRYW